MPTDEEITWLRELRQLLGMGDLAPDAPSLDEKPADARTLLVGRTSLPAPVGFVALQRSRLAWAQARQSVKKQLADLAKAIVDDRPEEAKAMKRLDDVLAVFDTQVIDVLDLALDAEGPVRLGHQQKAAKLVRVYQAELGTNELARLVDENPWRPLTVRQTLRAALAELAERLE